MKVPTCWNLPRKHVRVVLANGTYIKLNRYRNRLNARNIKNLCVKFAPIHVYFSVLDWLFPERVGKKSRASRAIPIGGEYVCDIDSSNIIVPHKLELNDCIELAKLVISTRLYRD